MHHKGMETFVWPVLVAAVFALLGIFAALKNVKKPVVGLNRLLALLNLLVFGSLVVAGVLYAMSNIVITVSHT